MKGHKLFNKAVAVVLALVLALGVAPAAIGGSIKAYAASASPSVSAYATKAQLTDSSTFNPGTSGTAANIGKIKFGGKAWYLLGGDGTNVDVLAAEDFGTSQFQSASESKEFIPDTSGWLWESVNYSSSKPNRVWTNHYGVSTLRQNLKYLEQNSNGFNYFNTVELGMMNTSTVTTLDEKEDADYTTSDKLYAAAATGMNVTNIEVAGKTLPVTQYSASGDNFWLRSASGFQSNGLCVYQWTSSRDVFVRNINQSWGIRPAANLNFSSVLFASAAAATTSDTAKTKINSGTTMNLRLEAKDSGTTVTKSQLGNATVIIKGDAITATKGTAGTVTLVVQGNDGTNDWYYTKALNTSGETEITADQIGINSGDLENCKVWLEATGSDSMIYATSAAIDTSERYTVTFKNNNGTDDTTKKVAEGNKITAPSVTKPGYEVEGWYQDEDFTGTAWDFANNTVTENVTLYAKWVEDSDFSYVINPDESVTIGKYKYNIPYGVTGSVTIGGWNEDSTNPNITFAREDGQLTVALAANAGTKTTYTAGSSSTKFTMSKDDTNATKIDLLDNGSTVKDIAGVTVSGGNNIIKAVNSDAAISLSEGNATLVGGKGLSAGTMRAVINATIYEFDTADEIQYTVDTDDKTLAINGDGAVKMDDKVTFTGKANDAFGLDVLGDITTVVIPKDATVEGTDEVVIKGLNSADYDDKATKVAIDEDGKLTVIDGAASIAGEATVASKIGDKTVNVTIPEGKTCIIDTTSEPPQVGKLVAGESITIDGIEYSVTDDSSLGYFPLDKGGLVGTGDTAKVPAGTAASITIFNGDDETVIDILQANEGIATIVKGAPSTVTLTKAGDKFTLNEQTYRAASDNTAFALDAEGNVAVTEGAAKLENGESIIGGGSGKTITNTADTGDDAIIVIPNKADGKDEIILAKAGNKVKIGDVKYEAVSDNTKIVVGEDGNTVTEGAVKLDDGESIIGGGSGKIITNPADTGEDEIVVVVNTEDGNDEVILSTAGSKVKIGDVEYEAANDNTKIVIGENGNTVSEGAVKLDDGESIIGGGSGKIITNPADTGEDEIVVIPNALAGKDEIILAKAGNKVKIGDVEYEAAKDNTKIVVGENANALSEGAVKLDDGESIIGSSGQLITNPAGSGKDQITVIANSPVDGKDSIVVPAGGKVKIGNKEYVAGDKGMTLAVDKNGKVTLIAGSIKTDENADKDNNGTDGSESDSSSKTGDDTNVFGLLALLSLAGAGAGTVFIRRRHS